VPELGSGIIQLSGNPLSSLDQWCGLALESVTYNKEQTSFSVHRGHSHSCGQILDEL
jgi:hypothetical protein